MAFVLVLIEITFSFENAIINAKVLGTLSKLWQTIFLTVGIAIAIFGMRIVFPIAIVALTADLSWQKVLNLALNHPQQYAAALNQAHVSIAAFGGAFLTMLFWHFFLDSKRRTLWFAPLERPLAKLTKPYSHIAAGVATLIIVCLLPANPHPVETFQAGLVGLLTYITIHGLADFFGRKQTISPDAKKTGLAGFIGFLYLEVLDASFSFDGVIGAFAVTDSVILIAAGLGIGAVWVRSLTVFMVRRGTLNEYRYLEHGAHYTIGLLAAVLFAGIFVQIPEALAGIGGVVLIGGAIASSVMANKKQVN